MQLSEHFKLSEFLRSATAEKLGIPNIPLKRDIPAMQNLCERSLEPLRQALGLPILISSGYRCPLLNAAVKGVQNSQHIRGEAADITIPRQHRPFAHSTDEQAVRLLYKYAKEYSDYDQLILEHYGSSWWLHISCKIDYRRNRHEVIENLTKR